MRYWGSGLRRGNLGNRQFSLSHLGIDYSLSPDGFCSRWERQLYQWSSHRKPSYSTQSLGCGCGGPRDWWVVLTGPSQVAWWSVSLCELRRRNPHSSPSGFLISQVRIPRFLRTDLGQRLTKLLKCLFGWSTSNKMRPRLCPLVTVRILEHSQGSHLVRPPGVGGGVSGSPQGAVYKRELTCAWLVACL